jgi:hypothetical protein
MTSAYFTHFQSAHTLFHVHSLIFDQVTFSLSLHQLLSFFHSTFFIMVNENGISPLSIAEIGDETPKQLQERVLRELDNMQKK